MAIEKCPHCFRQVLPTQERMCPSCGERIDQGPADQRAGCELVWLGKTSKLPDICVQCGTRTDQWVELQEFSTSRARAFFGNLFRLPCQPGLALIGLFRPELAVDEGYRMLRRVPCCARCKKSNPPRIHTADHHYFRIGILVRREIAEQLKRQA